MAYVRNDIGATNHMIVESSPRIGCNTQGIYIMKHGNVAIMGESNMSNMRANGASNT